MSDDLFTHALIYLIKMEGNMPIPELEVPTQIIVVPQFTPLVNQAKQHSHSFISFEIEAGQGKLWFLIDIKSEKLILKLIKRNHLVKTRYYGNIFAGKAMIYIKAYTQELILREAGKNPSNLNFSDWFDQVCVNIPTVLDPQQNFFSASLHWASIFDEDVQQSLRF